MKKFLSYILISLAIVSISIETTTAKEISSTTDTNSQQILIASEVQPTIIPKAETLVGPSVEDQANTTGGARSIFITRILPYVAISMIGMAGGISLLFIIIGGVRFSTAYGNEENITKAKDQVVYAIVGFLVSLMAYTIVTTVTKIDLVKQEPKQNPNSNSINELQLQEAITDTSNAA